MYLESRLKSALGALERGDTVITHNESVPPISGCGGRAARGAHKVIMDGLPVGVDHHIVLYRAGFPRVQFGYRCCVLCGHCWGLHDKGASTEKRSMGSEREVDGRAGFADGSADIILRNDSEILETGLIQDVYRVVQDRERPERNVERLQRTPWSRECFDCFAGAEELKEWKIDCESVSLQCHLVVFFDGERGTELGLYSNFLVVFLNGTVISDTHALYG